MIRLVATDMDGTLLTHDKKISFKNKEALRIAQEKGVILTLASGRGERSLIRYAQELDMYRYGGYLICNNGQKVISLKDGEVIENPVLSQDIVQRIFRFAKNNRLQLIMEGEKGTSTYTPLHMNIARFVYRRIKKLGYQLRKNPKDSRFDLFTLFSTHPVTHIAKEDDIGTLYFKIGISHRKVRLDKIIASLTQEFGQDISIYRVTETWIDLVAYGVSKAMGLKQILDMSEIPTECVMAIGDSENDIEMLNYAGIGVAMGNAMSTVLAIADEVTLSNEDDGVAVIVLKHI